MTVFTRQPLVILTTQLVSFKFSNAKAKTKKILKMLSLVIKTMTRQRLVIQFLEGKLVNADESDECDDSYINTIH